MPRHEARRKAATVEAVRYDGSLLDVVELVGAGFRWDGTTLSVIVYDVGPRTVHEGDWIVPTPRGFDVVSGEAFAEQYEVTGAAPPIRSGGPRAAEQGDMLDPT